MGKTSSNTMNAFQSRVFPNKHVKIRKAKTFNINTNLHSSGVVEQAEFFRMVNAALRFCFLIRNNVLGGFNNFMSAVSNT